jgi:hypothetical protein
MMVRERATETDCADCGASDARYRFRGNEAICEGCAPQYFDEDLQG